MYKFRPQHCTPLHCTSLWLTHCSRAPHSVRVQTARTGAARQYSIGSDQRCINLFCSSRRREKICCKNFCKHFLLDKTNKKILKAVIFTRISHRLRFWQGAAQLQDQHHGAAHPCLHLCCHPNSVLIIFTWLSVAWWLKIPIFHLLTF